MKLLNFYNRSIEGSRMGLKMSSNIGVPKVG
jgi:hypothetical protein